jgi:hypothetical protein
VTVKAGNAALDSITPRYGILGDCIKRLLPNTKLPVGSYTVDLKIPEQVRPNVLGMITFAEIRTGEQGNDVHDPQQPPDPLLVDTETQCITKVIRQFPVAP